MKNSLKTIGLLFLVGGLGIIIAVFFVLLKKLHGGHDDIFYLNLVVACIVYLAVFLRSYDLLGDVKDVGRSSSGYGFKWLGTWIYAIGATALIILSIILRFSFGFSLIGHLILLFILLSSFFIGASVKANVNDVVDKIEARKSGLKEIAAQIDLLDLQDKLKGSAYHASIEKLREDVRFITASDNPSASAMEARLLEKIQLISRQIESGSQSAETIRAGFEECASIIAIRKKQY